MELKNLLEAHTGNSYNTSHEAIYAIHEDVEVEVYSSLKEAINSNPRYIIATSVKGRLKSFYDEYYFVALNYAIYDSKGNKTSIREGNWECIEIDEPVERSSIKNRTYRLKDPKGKVINSQLKDLSPNIWDGISSTCNVIKILRCLRPYSSWHEVELKMENIRLLKENQILKDKIRQLEQELA